MATKYAMHRHGQWNDWCHLCGERSDTTVDIWYPENAEHDEPVNPGLPHEGRKYIRVCKDCGERIAEVATETK